ncbi:hypothetical protein LPJ61_007051, partial [Coemansia biformis]
WAVSSEDHRTHWGRKPVTQARPDLITGEAAVSGVSGTTVTERDQLDPDTRVNATITSDEESAGGAPGVQDDQEMQ